jgi:hypothetical protein
MADLSLSLSNKGKPGAFSLSSINSSKLTNNTFSTSGFKPNTKNLSNVNPTRVNSITKSTTEKKVTNNEDKAPLHDEVFPSSPSPEGGYEVTDLLGRRHTIKPGVTSDEALDIILGKNWVSRNLWNIVDGTVQGLSIYATGGASQLVVGGRAWMSIQAARRSLLGIKAGMSTLRYYYDPSQSNGHPNSFVYSLALGFGGQIKFGNISDALSGLVAKNSILYKLAHTSHDWHDFANTNSIQSFSLKTTLGGRFYRGGQFIPGGDRAPIGGAIYGGLKVGFNNIYYNQGLDNLEKQWFTATALYKGKAFKSPYQYQIEHGGTDESHGGSNDYYTQLGRAQISAEVRNNIYTETQNKLDSESENIQFAAGKFGTAYDRYVSRDLKNKAEGLNFLGNYVAEHKNKGIYLSEQIEENRLWIQNYNWEVKEQILNGNLFEKAKGIASLPGLIGSNLTTGAQNLIYLARGLVNSGTTTVVAPIGGLAYDTYMMAMIKLAIKDPVADPKVTKQVTKALGTKELYVKQTAVLKGNKNLRLPTENELREFYGVSTYEYENAPTTQNGFTTQYQRRNIEKEAKLDKGNKALYDRRDAMQKELAALKKEHEAGWVFTKKWTDAENARQEYLTGWIKTYNESIAIIENRIRSTPPKTSVETPKRKR